MEFGRSNGPQSRLAARMRLLARCRVTAIRRPQSGLHTAGGIPIPVAERPERFPVVGRYGTLGVLPKETIALIAKPLSRLPAVRAAADLRVQRGDETAPVKKLEVLTHLITSITSPIAR
jgi:hypothetical protein